MDPQYIPPALERHWAEEVLYLHSLWHQASPQNANPSPNLNLRPINSTNFKKTKKRKMKNNNQSEVEWPINPSPDQHAVRKWPEPDWNPSAPQPRPPLSEEEHAREAALRLQQTAIKPCRDFFLMNDSDDDAEEEEESEDGDEEEAKAFEFFLGLFVKNGELGLL